MAETAAVDLADASEFGIQAIVNDVLHPRPTLASYARDASPRPVNLPPWVHPDAGVPDARVDEGVVKVSFGD